MFAAGLLVSGHLRALQQAAANPPALASWATALYIVLTILAAVALRRSGVPLRRFGFRASLPPVKLILLGFAGVALTQAAGLLLEPLWERVFDATRELSRFSDVAGSPGELVKLLALSWTFAAFGEELAFRILLLRGVAYALGDSRTAFGVALVVQAIVFGLVHAYQGPAGIAGAAFSGLIYGALTLAARGAIWPAALAHGLGNTIGILQLYSA